MSRGKPVELSCGLAFATQKAASEFFRAMRARYAQGDRINGDDSCHLSALLERHPEYPAKVGVGVSYFVADVSTDFGSSCFRLVRHDGTATDFSWTRCVTGRGPSQAQEVSAALRYAVRYDVWRVRDRIIADHRDENGRIPCAVTGERVSPEDCRIDHRPPMTFQVIVSTFLAANGLRHEDVLLSPERDNSDVTELQDASLVERFRRFHADVAQIDMVEKGAHAQQNHVYRLKPTRARIVLGDVPAYEQPQLERTAKVVDEDLDLDDLIGGAV